MKPVGESEDKEEDDADEVDGCTLDDDDEGDGGGDLLNSSFSTGDPSDNLSGKYLMFCIDVFG